MTSFKYSRCKHCNIKYEYLASGYSENFTHTDSLYCPECSKAISDALEKIPVKFRAEWVDTYDVTVSELKEYRKKYLEEEKKKYPNRILGERIVAPLFYLPDLENKHSVFVIEYLGKTYLVENWSKTPELNSVRILMEKNMMTGELKPWRKI